MIVGSLGGCSSHRSTSLAMLTHWSPIRSTHRMMMGSCQDTRETGDSASASAWWSLCGAIGRSRGADGPAEDRVEPSIGCPSTSKFPRRRPQSSSNTAVAGFARILAVRRMAQSGSVVVSPRDLITPEQIDRTPRRRPGASPGRGHAAGPAPPWLQVLADRSGRSFSPPGGSLRAPLPAAGSVARLLPGRGRSVASWSCAAC